MGILLGNLTVQDFEQRLGIKFSDEDRNALKEMRQEEASNLQPGKIHIFDLPFTVACGDSATQKKVLDILYKFDTSKFPPLSIGVR